MQMVHLKKIFMRLLVDKEIPGEGKKNSKRKRSIVPNRGGKTSKKKRTSKSQNVIDNMIACQPIANEASFLPHRSELTNIADKDDMSLDSAEGNYDLELTSAYKADVEDSGLGVDTSKEDEKDFGCVSP